MGTEQTHVVPAKVPLPLWWQPAHHQKCPKIMYALKIWQSWGHVCCKKALYVYTCLFFVHGYLIVEIPVNSASVHFMHGILSTPWWRQKQQSALKIGKNWRVLKQPAGLRWAFLFYAILMCQSISHYFSLSIFDQDILFTYQTETLNSLGPKWSVLVLVSGGCMFSPQWKVAMKWNMRMPWRHHNQPVIVIVFNIENTNWI